MLWPRKRYRVRVHLIDPPHVALPSVEGVLVATRPDIHIAVPALVFSTEAAPAVLNDAKLLVIPRERVAFFEVLR